MPRNYQPVEFNTFVGGLVTEASPLTFPLNASLDEENFTLNKDGTRSRRAGLQFETGFGVITSDSALVDGELVTSSFKWTNAGGLSTNTIVCVQMGNTIDFFQGNAQTISLTKFYTYTFSGLSPVLKFSYASVDGKLVVANGQKQVCVFTYDNSIVDRTKAISVKFKKLFIRDLFGLDDISGGRDLRAGTDISWRPGGVTGNHIYNLRNQGWATPRPSWTGDNSPVDVMQDFANNAGGQYPSNADNITSYIYANTDSKSSKTLQRFDVENIVNNPPANTESPIGYFIIDALDRGNSRRQAISDLASKYPENNFYLNNAAMAAIRADQTPSGATCVCEYGGRVWYAGFPGQVTQGDTHSPKLNSYLLFSRLVTDEGDINLCYQVADPTDPNGSDLVDTDGGFLRVEGAYGIYGMAVLQSTLFVLAENGIWSVSGGSTSGFTATNYQVAKLTSSGCISQGSIVVMQDSIFYWGVDGIYAITRNEFGDFKSSNITNKTIKSFYMAIPDTSIRKAEGIYDSYDGYVKWLFNNYLTASDDVIELNLDVNTGAYFKYRIKTYNTGFPLLIKAIQTDPYRIIQISNNIIISDGSDVITADGSQVVVGATNQVGGLKEITYLTLTSDSTYTFSGYSEPFHYDWTDIDGFGMDAKAFLLTGVLAGGDYQRGKQIIYQTTHFSKTETGVEELYFTSRPYPALIEESLQVGMTPTDGLLKLTLHQADLVDSVNISLDPLDGALRLPLVGASAPPEFLQIGMQPTDGLLRSIQRSYGPVQESLSFGMLPQSGSLIQTLITYSFYNEDKLTIGATPLTGALS